MYRTTTRRQVVPAIGDTIVIDTWGGTTATIVVDLVTDDIKNGEPGVAGTLVPTDPKFDADAPQWNGLWAYMDDVIRITATAK